MSGLVSSRPQAVRLSEDYRRVAGLGFGLIVATFGVLGAWAALTPLSSANIGNGVVAVDTHRQTVQHLEGGMVSQLLVHEGDHVQAGQTLFQLDPVQTDATLDIARNQMFSLVAKSDRLIAERDNSAVVRFSPELASQVGDPVAAQAMAAESREFVQRRITLQSQVAVLETRKREYADEIDGVDRQRASMEAQVALLDEEIKGLTDLFKQGLVPRPRLLALQRDRAQLQGDIGRAIADRVKTQAAVGETELQIDQLRQQSREEVSKDLADAQTQAGDIRQRYIVAKDQARRIAVTAPMAGTVQNLRIFTRGAVVRAGDPLLDIAPDQGRLIIQARFSPNDVETLHAGQQAQIRFPTFHQRTLPVVHGIISSVSQDSLTDDATHTSYFLVIAKIDANRLPREIKDHLRAGMPAEVIVPTRARTALQYLIEPMVNTLSRTMREN